MLRLYMGNLDHCREDFLDKFTTDQLVQIARMHVASEWDFYPDVWTERQIKEALRGKPPNWGGSDKKPVYD